MTTRRIVVTGLGVVAGQDCGADALSSTLSGSTMKTSPVDDRQGYHVAGASRRAVLTRGVDLTAWVSPAAARRMSPSSRLAVAAARMAIVHAGLSGGAGGPSTGVVMSSSFGPVTSTEQLLQTASRDGPQAVSPFSFAESVANAAAGQVAIAIGAHGSNITIVQREAGGLTAVGRAAELIASGRAERVLAGSVDEVPAVLHAVLGRFDALARPSADGSEAARPFDVTRSGFVVAEGAVVLVLEDAEAARARGSVALARILGFGGAFDSTAPRVGWGSGHVRLAGGLSRAFDVSRCLPTDVTRIVSGASGAVAGDRLEAEVLKAAWAGAPLPPILVPKAHVGQYGGGFLAAAILSVGGGVFGAAPPVFHEDPVLGIRPFAGGTLAPAALSLFTAVASGGSASWLLAEAC